MKINQKIVDLVALLCLIAIIIVSFLPFSPLKTPVPSSDSGIFIHIGSEILKGKVLYQQVWDNKQPLLYAVNAFALWIGGGSIWGVWGVELAFYLALSLLVYRLLRKALSPFISLAVILSSYLTIHLFMDGNYSEEYAVVIQTLILAVLFFVYLPNKHRFSRSLSVVLMGALSGLAFCFKQTYLDAAVAAFIYIIFIAWQEKDKKIYLRILYAFFGFMLINLPVFLYFQVHHALNDYLINAFLFYRYYASQGPLELIHSLLEVVEFMSAFPFLFVMTSIWLAGLLVVCVKGFPRMVTLLQKKGSKWVTLLLAISLLGLFVFAQLRGGYSGIGLLEWIALIFGILFLALTVSLFTFLRRKSTAPETTSLRQSLAKLDWKHPGAAPFLFLGLIDLPILIFGIALTGMNFNHYYISLFPALLLLLAAAAAYLANACQEKSMRIILNVSLVAIMAAGLFVPALQLIRNLQAPVVTNDSRAEAAAYLKSVTTPQDTILQWGWDAIIYFLADREAPTRYSIQFPAYFNTPWRSEVLATLLNDIQSKPPLYIADTNDPVMPFIEGATTSQCLTSNPVTGNRLQKILNFVCSHYEFVKSFGKIAIYRYTG